jgi:hypothetical protein
MVGSGKGAWQIRGVQLGAALGARVVHAPSEADWRWADLVVLVKRAGAMYAAQAHRFGVPIVWDALDFWRQPGDNHLSEADARRLLAQQIETIRPALTIGSTRAMTAAAEGVYLPHHGWPGLTPTPARDEVQVVAYQGGEVFLGRWRQVLEAACQRRGWRFVVNPTDLRDADILVAFRDGQWDGWMCQEWKSGVKIVNAIAAGRPIITQASAAAREVGYLGTSILHGDRIDVWFDLWAGAETRAAVVMDAIEQSRPMSIVAAQYAAILADVRDRCAA